MLKLSGLEIGGNAPGAPDDADCGEVKDGKVGCEDGGIDIGEGWRALAVLWLDVDVGAAGAGAEADPTRDYLQSVPKVGQLVKRVIAYRMLNILDFLRSNRARFTLKGEDVSVEIRFAVDIMDDLSKALGPTARFAFQWANTKTFSEQILFIE